MTQPMMFFGMAATAKRHEILKRVVAELFCGCRAFAVDVMNMQVLYASAMLAGVLIALQGGFAVAAEQVIVFGGLCVLLLAFRIKGKPAVNAIELFGLLATRAAVLGSGLVFKVITAIRAHQHSANGRGPFSKTKLAQPLSVLFGFECVSAGRASFLMASSWLVGCATLHASSFGKANACLPMCLQRTGLASFHVGRGLGDGSSAVGAGKGAVLAHGQSNASQRQSHCSIGVE